MPLFSFVLRETLTGVADHDNHLKRRNIALARAKANGCSVPHDPVEMEVVVDPVSGKRQWHYHWILEADKMSTINGIIKIFTQDHTKVEVAHDPVQHKP